MATPPPSLPASRHSRSSWSELMIGEYWGWGWGGCCRTSLIVGGGAGGMLHCRSSLLGLVGCYRFSLMVESVVLITC